MFPELAKSQYFMQYLHGPIPGAVGSIGVNSPAMPFIDAHNGATSSHGIVAITTSYGAGSATVGKQQPMHAPHPQPQSRIALR
jgi:hypothetical protein